MENYTFLISALLSIKYVSVTNILKRRRELWAKSRGGLEDVGWGGGGVGAELESFIYSITG